MDLYSETGLGMMTRANLQTARLTLRPMVAGDEADILAAMTLDVARWLSSVPHPYSASDFQHFLNHVAVIGKTYVIEDAFGFAGVIGVERSLGYWLAPRAHGLGYATEAARAVLSSRFLDDPAPIAAGYFAENDRSANVLGKLGFRQTGQEMKHCKALDAARVHMIAELGFANFVAHLPFLRSERLSYRPMLSHDAPALHAIVSQWAVTRQLGSFPWPSDADFSASRCQPYVGDGFAWGIFLGGNLIGTVAITKGALGYMIDPAHHRQGFGREAVSFALDHARLPYVEAEVWHDNAASLGLLHSLGFSVLNPSKHMSKARGVRTDGFRLAWFAPAP